MTGQFAVADSHGRNLGKGRLERIHQLRSELVVHAVTGIGFLNVPRHIGVKKNWIFNLVGILSESLDGDVDVQADVSIDDPEGNRIGGAELVVHHLLHIEVVDALIFACVTAHGEPVTDLFEGRQNVLAKRAVKERGLRRGVVDVFTRIGAEVDDSALFNDDHALAVIDRDDGSI